MEKHCLPHGEPHPQTRGRVVNMSSERANAEVFGINIGSCNATIAVHKVSITGSNDYGSLDACRMDDTRSLRARVARERHRSW